MDIHLRDTNLKVAMALADQFMDTSVLVNHESIFLTPAEAIVSPANSYGWMDGGIDKLYLDYFGIGLQEEVFAAIANYSRPKNFLPVGAALIVRTGNPNHPHLIVAPTMEKPGPVPDTQNAYLAFLAALRCAEQYGISSIVCPGMCTLTGKMPPMTAAKQMREAYEVWMKGLLKSKIIPPGFDR